MASEVFPFESAATNRYALSGTAHAKVNQRKDMRQTQLYWKKKKTSASSALS